MQITPIAHLTTAQLRELGSAAADRGESMYEAEIRSGLTSDELLHFEAGYFARQFEAQGQGVSGVDEGCFIDHAPMVVFLPVSVPPYRP